MNGESLPLGRRSPRDTWPVPAPAAPQRAATAPIVRRLGCREYLPAWSAMQELTRARGTRDPDEIWLMEHPPVFTLGRNGKAEHVLSPGAIPVVDTDRGGQITYHGPGQLMVYPLLDLRRLDLGVRRFVDLLEGCVIDLLAAYGIRAGRRAGAPGVYCGGAKIAAVGLRITNGCSYHGLSLNVAMDLEPFTRIDPCGYPGMAVTQVADEGGPARTGEVADALAARLIAALERHRRTRDTRRGTPPPPPRRGPDETAHARPR